MSNKIRSFDKLYSERLQTVQIENNDACVVVKAHDSENTFVYCDPPYVGARQGHYGGYEQIHFDELLETLSQIKGKFLLSSYQNEELTKYVDKMGWYQKRIKLNLGSSNLKGTTKTEILIANYPIE
ncbi:DNA adenine methylase [Capnocytophaga catalasegens]|uniref:DNA adenine methylase n=1 Tax=Capnocytophaga catalasegens TaxID=1004260 RepID=UPI00222FFEDB|nr:DNA adenine methylase [Capnocytophaga catalasegens]